MELSFTRDHVLQTAPTHPKTLAVFPAGKNKQQKVIVGDSEGSVQCFSFKPVRAGSKTEYAGSSNGGNSASSGFHTQVRSSELTQVFKHLPTGIPVEDIAVSSPMSAAMSAVYDAQGTTGSATTSRNAQQKDKAFLAVGNSVYGLNKRGKEFFRFKTNVTESITGIRVHGVHLHTLSKYMYSHYVNCEDKNYFLANDVINEMTLTTLCDASTSFPASRSTKAGDPSRAAQKLLSVLACQDGYIRVVNGSELYYEAALQGGVTVLNNDYIYTDSHSDGSAQDSNELIYGLDSGTIGQMVLTNDAIRRGWVIDGNRGGGFDGSPAAGTGLDESAGAGQASNATVRSILSKLDVTRDGVNDVVVGRDDGMMEVYGFNFNGDPELLFNRNIGETVHTVDGGFITNDETEEIIAQTYSGKVLCFHQSNSDADKDSILAAPAPVDAKLLQKKKDNEKAIEALNREVSDLQKAVKKEQERYARISNNFIQTVASFHVKDKFSLNQKDGSYTLQLETTVPVATLAIQTEIEIAIEDVMADYSGSIQCSRAQGGAGNESRLITYRCHVPMKRIELKIWIDEGHEGKIQVFLVPVEKDTAGSVCTYKVMPLSLHKRVHNTTSARDTPMSELALRGQFIIAEAHAWIAVCLPELPSTYNVDDTLIEYTFHGSSSDTVLEACIEDGLIILRSDSIPALQTLKSYVVAEATAQHIKLGVQFTAHPEGLRHFCESMWPKLSRQRSLERNLCLADGLLEIKRQEEDTVFLSEDLSMILGDAEKMLQEYSEQPKIIDRLTKAVIETYVIWHKLKGRNVEASIKRIAASLHSLEHMEDLMTLLSS